MYLHRYTLLIFHAVSALNSIIETMASQGFLRVKRILDDIRETEDETRKISEVLRMKGILNNGGYKTEGVLCCLLLKLKQMVSSVKVLEASMIRTSVSGFMKHESKDVRRTARMLVRSWRRMVDEWVAVHASVVQCGGESNKKYQPTEKPVVQPTKFNVTKRNPKEPNKLQQKKRLNMVVLEKRSTTVDRPKPSATVETTKLQKPTLSVVPVMSLDKKSVEEKLEATKRKIHEHYKDAETSKRQRRIQVIEVHDVLRLGLAPKHQDSRFGKHISHRVVGSVR
ncbi:putative transcription regulator IWS1 family [Helianthus debilis subsp. tardiflorus]